MGFTFPSIHDITQPALAARHMATGLQSVVTEAQCHVDLEHHVTSRRNCEPRTGYDA